MIFLTEYWENALITIFLLMVAVLLILACIFTNKIQQEA